MPEGFHTFIVTCDTIGKKFHAAMDGKELKGVTSMTIDMGVDKITSVSMTVFADSIECVVDEKDEK